MGPRFAIYSAPEPGGALWRFGSAALGYDAATGLDTPFLPDLPVDDGSWRRWTEDPRRYGFHGTLKAPFHLGPGVTEDRLLEAARTFAAGRIAFTAPRLAVGLLGAFVALVPTDISPDLNALAADCVRDFSPLRAPLSPADRERRLAAPLSARQRRSLDDWGYPFVFDDYRFHMTLSGPLPEERRASVRDWLAEAYRPIEDGPAIDALTVFRQADRTARFRILARYPFGV